ncbi:MAG TPA: hypothetical protein DCS93_07300 [Microscillaceae bacterium]|nr:hypothetical protein [Microscillaceae bacterium]
MQESEQINNQVNQQQANTQNQVKPSKSASRYSSKQSQLPPIQAKTSSGKPLTPIQSKQGKNAPIQAKDATGNKLMPIQRKPAPEAPNQTPGGIYDKIPWGELHAPAYTASSEVNLYKILRGEPYNWPSNVTTDTHIFSWIRSRYYDEQTRVAAHMQDSKNFKKGVQVWIPTFDAYKAYISSQAESDSEFKTFYDTHLKSEKSQKPTQNNNTKNVGGKPQSKRIMQIVWSFDDGPTKQTASLKKVLDDFNITAATWFVERFQVNTRNAYSQLKKVQDSGGEIAIHGVDPDVSGRSYFPSGTDGGYGKAGGNEVSDTLQYIKKFKEDLTKNKITAKFVRLPGGLISALAAYLKKEGVNNRYTIARGIIKSPETKHKEGSPEEKVRKDYVKFKNGISGLGLHLWRGDAKGPEIQTQSWQAETAGVGAKKRQRGADNTTGAISPDWSERTKKDDNYGVKKSDGKYKGHFEREVDKFGDAQTAFGSLVILGHDTTAEDVAAIKQDLQQMEDYAKEKNVRIEYVTKASLYTTLKGKQP